MTDDTIYRQAAIDKFEPWLKVKGYSEGELNMLKAVLYDLRELPSAQPERKKGKWVTSDGRLAKIRTDGVVMESCWCNQCEDWLVGSDEYAIKGFYCPNCGALMEGEIVQRRKPWE